MRSKEDNVIQYRILTVPGFKQELVDKACQTGSNSEIAKALGHVARSIGLQTVANETGLSKESFYRTFGPNGNPPLKSLIKFADALDVEIRLVPTKQTNKAQK
ncbi:putative addiction module antidote protein [Vibrio parahaemolyticus]|nr:putative addiction module antidote protein [Vibrio parahaemolyticus]